MYAELTGHQTISTQFFAGLSLSEYNTVDQSHESIVVQNLVALQVRRGGRGQRG